MFHASRDAKVKSAGIYLSGFLCSIQRECSHVSTYVDLNKFCKKFRPSAMKIFDSEATSLKKNIVKEVRFKTRLDCSILGKSRVWEQNLRYCFILKVVPRMTRGNRSSGIPQVH